MSPFLSFIQKEFHHIFRDHRTMLILLGIPIIEVILFGFAITTEIKNSKIAIFDPSNDIATQRIIERFKASDYFDVVQYVHSSKEIQQVFRQNKAQLVMVFDERFYETLLHTGKANIQLIADATDPNTATTITNYASSIISSYQQELMGQNKVPYQITPVIKLLYNPQMKGSFNFVPGVLGMILLLISAMMTSIAIVREKEIGTMEILLVSPMNPLAIILAKMVPYFLLSCVNLTTVLLISVFVLHVPIAGSLGGLILVSLIFLLVSLALGMLVSTLTDSQLVAMLMSSAVFMLPVILLSGMIYPIANMPIWLQWLSNIIPAKWYISAVRSIMIEGLNITFVFKEIMVLTLMFVILVAISLKKFKVRLE
jgi:ABC-2 type transport system permease protein